MEISLLGPLEVRLDDGSLADLSGARVRALLIRLALDAGRLVTHATLVDAVWGEEPPANAANALQALVSRVRRSGIPVEGHPAGYRLAVPPTSVDAARFEKHVAEGELDAALAMWRGPALADVADSDFARAPIARLTELHLTAAEDRLARGPAEIADIEELIAAHPLRERPVELLMRAFAGQGRQAEALAAFDRYRQILAGQLGTDPSPQLTQLHVAILRHEVQPQAMAAPTNLRATRTSFLGREDDLLKVGELITGSRLTTLTGPGGSGKTRLSIEAARAAAGEFPDGTWLIELAPVSEGTEVPQAMLTALGAQERKLRVDPLTAEPREPMERLIAALEHRRALIVLDNCEHLVDAVAHVADQLLSECPRLHLLATSREPLGVPGEALWPVEPLRQLEAERLLEERARAVQPGFRVDHGNQVDVAEICRALDGMPLAIELAAARLRTMTPAQLAARLDDRFRLLRGGSRLALPRHQTLRAVIDWSWDLLGDHERAVWQRLALFAGGATLEALGAVCGSDVLDVVTALADKSLVRVEADRYRMLETIREYGLERLVESGDEPAARAAWSAYFVDLTERGEPMLRTPEQLVWLGVYEAEHDNTHAVLRWAIGNRHTVTAMRLIAAVGWFWWLRGYRSEGASIVAEVLAMPGEVPDELRAMACLCGAVASVEAFGDFEQAQRWLSEATQLAEGRERRHPMLRLVQPMRMMMDAGLSGFGDTLPQFEPYFDDEDPWVSAVARAFHGHALLNLGGDADVAVNDFEIALDRFRRLGDRWGMGLVLDALATVDAQRGNNAAAAKHAQEAIDLTAPLGTEDQVQLRLRLAWVRWLDGDQEQAAAEIEAAVHAAEQLGFASARASAELARANLARVRGDLDTAKRYADRAGEMLRGVTAAPQFTAMVETTKGYVAGAAGHLENAGRHHDEALELGTASGDSPIVGMVLIGHADLALRRDQPEHAAALLGASAGIVGMVDRSVVDLPRIEAAAKHLLGEEGFAAAKERGSAYTLKDVALLARRGA